MKVTLVTALIFTMAVSPVLSTENNLLVVADYATFYNPAENFTYVELYYGICRHELGFVGSDSNTIRYAGVLISARVNDETGRSVDSASNYFLTQARDKTDQERTDTWLFDYLPMKISPGRYRISITVLDDVSKVTGTKELDVSVPDYESDSLTASDIELAYKISDYTEDDGSAAESRLVKEGRIIIPDPIGIYQVGIDDYLYAYCELYGLDEGEITSDGSIRGNFAVSYRIKDTRGNLIRDFGETLYSTPGQTAALSDCLDISSIPAGDYNLLFEAIDRNTRQQTISVKSFAIVDSAGAGRMPGLADIQLMADIAYYHMSEAEKIQLRSLEPKGRYHLIRQFWRNKDDDPSNPENPVYDESVRRFVFANENFSTDSDYSNGWKTDRGRVYITYGPYNERDEQVMPGKSYPFIKWTYHQLKGGCIFVFVNDVVAGAVDYRLVHSTHPYEKYDPKWRLILEDPARQEEDWTD